MSESEPVTPEASEPSSPVSSRANTEAATTSAPFEPFAARSNTNDAPFAYPYGKVLLLWAKTKVYIHPTSNKKDNISGVLMLTKEANSSNKEIKVSWISDMSLEPDNQKVCLECDLASNSGEHRSGTSTPSFQRGSSKRYFISKLSLSGGFYSFSLPISSIYSIQSRAPNLGWWWGSIIINSRSAVEKLPVLFFHDDESPSMIKYQSSKNKEFDPFGKENSGNLFYGGDQFFEALSNYAVVEKSSLESTIFLINPDSDDLRAFAPLNVKESGNKSAAVNAAENFNKLVTGAKWTILESLAKISQLAKNNVNKAIEDSPAPVKKILARPEVQRINDDFDTAHVYLAKWALSIQEEAEKNKKNYVMDTSYRNLLNSELGIEAIDQLSPADINKAQRRKKISKVEWDSFFDSTGRLSITVNEVKERIFHGGVSATVRPEAWLFLLEIYPWDSSLFERKQILKTLENDYKIYLNKWELNEELQHDSYWKDQRFRIEKDVNRNDRQVPLYRSQTGEDEEGEIFDEMNVKITNPHLKNLREILLTYNQYNENLGYVQGMCDILSVVYYLFQNNSIAFWCFAKFMDRMERNFLRDQSGMKTQMGTLNQLVSLMLPRLFLHLEKCDSINLFFFFRMLLVWFKREFDFEQVIDLWEVFLTDYYSSQFHLFFALAILSKHENIIINHLKRFDEVLRYMNDLALTMPLNDLLVIAELLFLRFTKLVDIIDRGSLNDKLNKLRQDIIEQNKRKGKNVPETSLPKAFEITDELRLLLSKEIIIQKEEKRDPEASTV